MTIMQIVLGSLLLIQVSCTSNKKNDKNENPGNNSNNDSCKTVSAAFNYPEDLNKLDGFNYICQDSVLKTFISQKIEMAPVFSDRNYALLNYDFRTKLLYDKGNSLGFCFKRTADDSNFNRKSIYGIYILDKNKMPLFLIEQLPLEAEASVIKLFYDNRHPQLYGYVVKRKKGKQIEMSELGYSDILEIGSELMNEEYVLTSKFVSYETPHFKTTPLWTDN